MKVIELIKKLNEIGYDENTELTFGVVNRENGNWYEAPFDEINYGIDLTGEPYHNDVINIDVDVDSVEEYQKEKTDFKRIILRFMLLLQKALKICSYGL